MIKCIPWLLLSLLCACDKPAEPPKTSKTPVRIVSLAPNITETLFVLGLKDRIVGVSRFSQMRERDTEIPIVGDFLNVNYESIIALQPDLVIIEKSSNEQEARLKSLDIPCLETDSLTLQGILASIRSIGIECGVENNGEKLIDEMQRTINASRNIPKLKPRTLLVFGEFTGVEELDQVYAFGAACIHSELLEIAGGVNVVTDHRACVTLSREAMIRLNPELIIELTAGGPQHPWHTLSSIQAVREERVHVITDPNACIPSPDNLMSTLVTFSKIIRSETVLK